MKKIVYILSILLVYATITYGQGISMTIGTKTSEVGQTVTIPINVSNFNNIGAISLKIQYNASVLDYIGISDQPGAGNITANASNGVLTIGWFNTTPLNLGNGKFLDMNFNYKGGSCDLSFQQVNCEVANVNGTVLVIDYFNGSVSPTQGTESKISLPEVLAVAGNEISVPLVFENFQNLGAVSLKINYDTNVLAYNGVSSELVANNLTANAANGVITIGWFDTTPLNIDSAKFIDIKFIYNGGISNLSFNTSLCEISSTSGSNIVTSYGDGKVFPGVNAASIHLADVQAEPGSNVTVPLTIENMSNIGAISLKIQYDKNILDSVIIEKGSLEGTFTSNIDNGVITIGWFDTNPLNADSIKFADIKLKYKTGSSVLTFMKSQCEIATVSGSVQFIEYFDGSVSAILGTETKVLLGSILANQGDVISVPITVENFDNIGAISFKINYNPSVLTFKGVENQPVAGNFTANADNGVLTIGWFNTSALSSTDGKLVDVKFAYSGGTSELTFDQAQSEVSEVNGTEVLVAYQNGTVSGLKNITFTISKVKGIAGQSVLVPVIAENLTNIGAISLKLNFDQTVLIYEGVENSLSSGNFTANANNGVVTIGWFDTNSLTSDSIKITDLKFKYLGGSSEMEFNESECEIADNNGSVVVASYVNGLVNAEVGSSPKLKIGCVSTAVGQIIKLPVTGENISNVGAVSLKIEYNSAVLSYVGVENQPDAGNFTVNAENGIVTLGWFNNTPLALADGKFVDLKFTYNGGGSSVDFMVDQCELAKTDGSIVSYVEYVNGSVAGNQPPVFTVFPTDTLKIAEDSLFTYEFKATDPNVDAVLKYTLSVAPNGAKIDTLSGVFTWKPSFTQSGKYNMTVVVSDGVLQSSISVPLLVINTNRPPVFTAVMPDQTIEYTSSGGENPTYTYNTVMFQYKATDPDAGTKLVYSVVTVPAITKNFIFYPTTGLFRWKPERGDENTYTFYLTVSDGIASITDTATVEVPTAVSVDKESEIPTEYSLMQNYPNPFNPTTKIKYALPQETRVVLSIYNLLGQRITILVDEVKPAGNHSVEFNAANLPTGFYIYKIEAKNYTSVKKMILMK